MGLIVTSQEAGGRSKTHVTSSHLPSAWTKNAGPSRIFDVMSRGRENVIGARGPTATLCTYLNVRVPLS
jgi:hypothetical protein